MDIIFFAALAAFIFYKLNKELGKVDEDEKRQIQEKLLKKREEFAKIQEQLRTQVEEKIIGASSTVLKNKAEEKIFENLEESSKQAFEAILKSCKISAEFFLNGAKSAFEMTIKAFAKADLETLKILLSEKIYQGFEAAIKQRNSEEKTLTTNIISIEKSEIISAQMQENNAIVAVKFVSKQINYISNKAGEVVEGRKEEISEITDIWTFKKDVTSPNPNWAVISTESK